MRARYVYIYICIYARVCDGVYRAMARQNIRAHRPLRRERERERPKASTEGARRNATGLSSPLINTSKATCKAVRVGSRVRLDSGEPPYPLEPSVHARALSPSPLPHALPSPPLSLSLFLHLRMELVSFSSYSCYTPFSVPPVPFSRASTRGSGRWSTRRARFAF